MKRLALLSAFVCTFLLSSGQAAVIQVDNSAAGGEYVGTGSATIANFAVGNNDNLSLSSP